MEYSIHRWEEKVSSFAAGWLIIKERLMTRKDFLREVHMHWSLFSKNAIIWVPIKFIAFLLPARTDIMRNDWSGNVVWENVPVLQVNYSVVVVVAVILSTVSLSLSLFSFCIEKTSASGVYISKVLSLKTVVKLSCSKWCPMGDNNVLESYHRCMKLIK